MRDILQPHAIRWPSGRARCGAQLQRALDVRTEPAVAYRISSVGRDANFAQDLLVELGLEQALSFPVPLQHGLPGTLEVEVERISPAALVLRVAGRSLARPKPDPSSVGDAR